jgi:hypothetical protein
LAIRFPGVKSPLYLTEKLAKWSTSSCALVLAYQPCFSKKKKNKTNQIKTKQIMMGEHFVLVTLCRGLHLVLKESVTLNILFSVLLFTRDHY